MADKFALDDDVQRAFSNAGRGNPWGMIRPGNIDLNNRPVVHNPDGSISTELSFSRGTDQGETLVPQLVNGQIVPQNQAWRHYLQTGQNMGTFSDPDYADSYAIQAHERPGIDNENMSRRPLYTVPTKPMSVTGKKFSHASEQ